MKKTNPFASSRVDNPFQTHADVSSVYKKEFDVLGSAIDEIKLDSNHQSKGLVVLGEAGSGKTHLMMRLAKQNLKSNRLFFIRQPNHPDFILYHVYSRMLDSFVEKVPGTDYSQLEFLLARSFAKITSKSLKDKSKPTKKDKSIINSLSKDSMHFLYKKMGGEGTQLKRSNWQYIENKLIGWWGKNYGLSGHSEELIKGLIKFCSYSDYHKRKLVRKWLSAHELNESELKSIGLGNWNENISKEAFSFEAIELFGKLSLEDEPLIIIFDQLEGLKYDHEILQKFGLAVKEILTQIPNSLVILNLFPDRWEHFKIFFDNSVTGRFKDITVLNKPPQPALKQILESKAEEHDMNLNDLFEQNELDVILAQNSIREVLNCASEYYRQKIYNLPIAPSEVKSFEEDVKEKLSKIQNDIKFLLKQALKAEEPSGDAAKIELPFTSETSSNNEDTIELPFTSERSLDGRIERSPEGRIIEYLTDKKQTIEINYTSIEIIDSTHDIGKLRTIMTMYKEINTVNIDQLRFGKRKLPEHLKIKTKKLSYLIGFLHENGASFTSRIKNFNQLVINNYKSQFRLFRDVREEPIKGKKGREEIVKLNNAANGKFLPMDRENRIIFELIYKLIVDIQNKNIEFSLENAFEVLKSEFKDYWLIALLQ